ncbi:hypothetical protein [Paenibacillus ehimensis]|uniref:hypothetical protein n=1 Tax=Paenibacillus ehimensis TaxID=79264 RepID=UPI000472C966|nr:hypothetical protein [Paenibacillus ehimensis]
MTPLILVDDLVSFIKPVVQQFVLESNATGISKAPQVIAGYLKEKKAVQNQNPPDFPYVIVRFLEDDDSEESYSASIRIIAGTYSEDEQNGWRDPVNILSRIKIALLENRIIGKPFWTEKPIKIELPEEQVFPEWVAWMTLRFTVPQVQSQVQYEGGF